MNDIMKKIIIALLLLVIVLLLVYRRTSGSSPEASGLGAIGPNPSQLTKGAMLSKQTAENCSTKFGQDWTDFGTAGTLCMKQ
jgi:hypothetical protein